MLEIILIDFCDTLSKEVINLLQIESHRVMRVEFDDKLKVASNSDLIILTVQSLSSLSVHWLDLLLSFQTPVIVVCKSCSIEVSMQLIRYGVVDCIAAENCLEQNLRNACQKATRLSVRRNVQDAFSVTIVPAYATSDASLLTANVAAAIARYSGHSRVVDLNFRGSEVPTYFGITPFNNIQHLFVDKHEIDEQLVEKAIIKHPSGVQLIGGPPTFANIDTSDLYHVDSIVRHLTENSKTIVMLEDPTHISSLSMLKEARKTIVTTQMNIVSLRKARHCVDLLKREGVPANTISIAAFKIDQAGEIPCKYAAKLIDVDEVISLPLNTSESNISLNLGVPTYLRLPNSEFSESIRRYFSNLIGMQKDQSLHEAPQNQLLSWWHNFVQRKVFGSGILTFN